jgi:hypothetical protein
MAAQLARAGTPAAMGFFDCARRLGRFVGDPNGAEARSFHAIELNAAQKFWGGHEATGNSIDAAALPGDAPARANPEGGSTTQPRDVAQHSLEKFDQLVTETHG